MLYKNDHRWLRESSQGLANTYRSLGLNLWLKKIKKKRRELRPKNIYFAKLCPQKVHIFGPGSCVFFRKFLKAFSCRDVLISTCKADGDMTSLDNQTRKNPVKRLLWRPPNYLPTKWQLCLMYQEFFDLASTAILYQLTLKPVYL